MPRILGRSILALLLLAVSATAQLDPAASQQATKELAVVAKAATFEHKVQTYDAVVNLAFTLALPMADAELDSFDMDSVESLRNALDGWVVDLQEASLAAAEMLAGQIPQLLTQAFGDAELYGRLPPGFLPGDGGVLDDARARLARRQAALQKAVDKVLVKVAAFVRKRVDVQLELQVLPPEIAWAAGDRDGALARLPERLTLDVLVVARSDTLVMVGTRVLLAGHADEAAGEVLVQLVAGDGTVEAGQPVTPVDGRWSATFADVVANPVVVRVSRGGITLAERCLGVP